MITVTSTQCKVIEICHTGDASNLCIAPFVRDPAGNLIHSPVLFSAVLTIDWKVFTADYVYSASISGNPCIDSNTFNNTINISNGENSHDLATLIHALIQTFQVLLGVTATITLIPSGPAVIQINGIISGGRVILEADLLNMLNDLAYGTHTYSETTGTPLLSPGECMTVVLPSEGVYIIDGKSVCPSTIEEGTDNHVGPTYCETESIVISEDCGKIAACIKHKIESLLCADPCKCPDPCLEGLKRAKFNSILGIGWLYLTYLNDLSPTDPLFDFIDVEDVESIEGTISNADEALKMLIDLCSDCPKVVCNYPRVLHSNSTGSSVVSPLYNYSPGLNCATCNS
jgi:hypothetical protein